MSRTYLVKLRDGNTPCQHDNYCDIKIEDGKLIVKYKDDDEPEIYESLATIHSGIVDTTEEDTDSMPSTTDEGSEDTEPEIVSVFDRMMQQCTDETVVASAFALYRHKRKYPDDPDVAHELQRVLRLSQRQLCERPTVWHAWCVARVQHSDAARISEQRPANPGRTQRRPGP